MHQYLMKRKGYLDDTYGTIPMAAMDDGRDSTPSETDSAIITGGERIQ